MRFIVFFCSLFFCSLFVCSELFCQTDNSIVLEKIESAPNAIEYGISLDNRPGLMDGGLSAEMVANGNFEAGTTDIFINSGKINAKTKQTSSFKFNSDTVNKWPSWNIINGGRYRASAFLDTTKPFHPSSPNSLKLKISKASAKDPVRLQNTGFQKMTFKKHEEYILKFDLKTDSIYKDSVLIELVTSEGKAIVQQVVIAGKNQKWVTFEKRLKAKKNAKNGQLSFKFISPGAIWIDNVSLIPANAINGLRKDIYEALSKLKPTFVRWPSNISAAGFDLNHRLKWKETIGPRYVRKGQRLGNGILSSNNFGYHEYLQLCENIGASAMLVCNCGIANTAESGEFCTDDELTNYITEALDAIEYAIGDTSTFWGAQRKANKHADPFNLHYIQIGYEDLGEISQNRYRLFSKAIAEKFPQIKVFSAPQSFVARDAEWHFSHHFKSDSSLRVIELGSLKAYPDDDFGAALSEAAWLTSIKKAPKQCFVSPSELVDNESSKDRIALLLFNGSKSYTRSSYEVLKLFSNNTVTLPFKSTLNLSGKDIPPITLQGFVGLGSQATHVVYKDFTVECTDKETYYSTFDFEEQDWDPLAGHWRFENNSYIQSDLGALRLSRLLKRNYTSAKISFKANKVKGENGFIMVFAGTDERNYYQINLGENGKAFIEKVTNGIPAAVSDSSDFTPLTDSWYQIEATIDKSHIACKINNQKALQVKLAPTNRRYVEAGFDSTHHEWVIKTVNAEPIPFKTTIDIKVLNNGKMTGKAFILNSNSLKKGNSFKHPDRIKLQTKKVNSSSPNFIYTFRPYSITVLRLKEVKP
jgi:alpha-L-arabinofuranosidase